MFLIICYNNNIFYLFIGVYMLSNVTSMAQSAFNRAGDLLKNVPTMAQNIPELVKKIPVKTYANDFLRWGIGFNSMLSVFRTSIDLISGAHKNQDNCPENQPPKTPKSMLGLISNALLKVASGTSLMRPL